MADVEEEEDDSGRKSFAASRYRGKPKFEDCIIYDSQDENGMAPRKGAKSQKDSLLQVLRVGDVMRILRSVIDHVILIAETPVKTTRVKVKSLDLKVDFYDVGTLEAASNLDTCDITYMCMVIDPVDHHIKVVAREEPTDTTQWEPVAVFLSPFTTAEINVDLFGKTIQQVVEERKAWSKMTAVNAGVSDAKLQKSSYPDDPSREQLIEELRKCWSSEPICTSMPIKVWQMYFVEKEDSTVGAAKEILRVMPVKCDRCLPTELWDALEQTEQWTELREMVWSTTASRSKVNADPVEKVKVTSMKQSKGLFGCLPCCRRPPPYEPGESDPDIDLADGKPPQIS